MKLNQYHSVLMTNDPTVLRAPSREIKQINITMPLGATSICKLQFVNQCTVRTPPKHSIFGFGHTMQLLHRSTANFQLKGCFFCRERSRAILWNQTYSRKSVASFNNWCQLLDVDTWFEPKHFKGPSPPRFFVSPQFVCWKWSLSSQAG